MRSLNRTAEYFYFSYSFTNYFGKAYSGLVESAGV